MLRDLDRFLAIYHDRLSTPNLWSISHCFWLSSPLHFTFFSWSFSTEAKTVPKRWQNGFFVLATNSAIDVGFVAASVVVYVCSLIWPNNLGAAWRVSLGLGAVPPFTLLFFRAKMQEPEHFQKNAMKKVSVPWWLIVKRYWVKISAVSLAWVSRSGVICCEHHRHQKRRADGSTFILFFPPCFFYNDL